MTCEPCGVMPVADVDRVAEAIGKRVQTFWETQAVLKKTDPIQKTKANSRQASVLQAIAMCCNATCATAATRGWTTRS